MNKDNKLIEALIEATEKNRVEWKFEDWAYSNHVLMTYPITEGLALRVDKNTNVLLIKYGGQQEKVDLLLFDKENGVNTPALIIEEEDIEKPHRLWTLYKFASRNASGADKLIDNIISKLSDDVPF
ncbi:hypothetical protein QIX46_00465 [Lysinibacillus boronitolerans]|nr:hypothetical protein QIX46_00465 [Lysinibacillus boronitolerans]